MSNFIQRVKRSLFWRISLLFFSILTILAISYIVITIALARRYWDETTQKVNANVADLMLKEVKPFVNGEVNKEALNSLMSSMMAVNPSLEVYLLDMDGKILSYVVLHKKVKLKYVSLQPIRDFIDKHGKRLVYGDDPRNPGQTAIFSASPVYEDGVHRGYVYLILDSEVSENIASTLQDSYLLKIVARSSILTFGAVAIISLLSLWLLLKSLREIIQTVRKFSSGDMQARIPVRSKGELTELATSFNNMADTILRNMNELKEVDRLRRDLIANISHDIRTPISIIHGYVETLIMKHGEITEAKQTEYLQTVMKSTDRLKRLMADLFELSKLESRQIKPKMESFFLSELLQDTSQKYKLTAQDRGIDLETEISSQLLVVHADLALIERVFQNLLDNALLYTPERGKIKITSEAAGDKVKVSVINSGVGISKQDLPKIFDRYYKVESSQSPKGTGLGLAIVKNILELHETDIKVESVKHGLTSFSFDLPLAMN